MPGRWQILDADDPAGWIHIRLMVDSEALAKRRIFGLGADCDILDPPDLAQSVLADATRLAAHLSP